MPGISTEATQLILAMVIVIHQSTSTQNALFYNEKKVEQKKALFFKSANTPTINPFAGSKKDRLNTLKKIEDMNSRVKKKGLHISVNPTVTDLVKLGDTGIRNEIGNLMEHLGYSSVSYSLLDSFKGWNLQEIDIIRNIESTGIPLGKKFKSRNGIAT